MSKKNRKKARKANGMPSRPPAMRLLAALEEVEDLEDGDHWDEAAERLERLDRQYPRRPEVLGDLVDIFGRGLVGSHAEDLSRFMGPHQVPYIVGYRPCHLAACLEKVHLRSDISYVVFM